MKGLYLHGTNDLRYETIPDPQIKDEGDMIVKVKACGICGSDLHYLHGVIPQSGFCIGHEAVGEVVEVGRGVKQRKPGDMVMMSATVGCGRCGQCLAGQINRCEVGFRSYGGHGLEGCQAEAVLVPMGDYNSAFIPEGLSLEQALMLTDAQATAYYACVNAEIKPGKTVMVIGLGPIGLMAVQTAYVMGASRVFAVDVVDHRRALGAELGATVLTPENAHAAIAEQTKGRLIDCVVEVVGIDSTVRAAIEMVCAGGIVSVIGANVNPAFSFPMGLAFFKSVTFRIGANPIQCFWPELVPLMQQGRLTPERFITHRMPLSEGLKAYQIFDQKLDGVLKPIMTPDD
jgi:2-desacetyl-2-hydroxyethyl bacteriochlorophyllide A dehydrogenase